MTDNIIRTVYADGRTEEREMTADEIAEQEASRAEAIAFAQALEAEAEAKEQARLAGIQKLVNLGLTEAEAQALVS